MGECLATGRTRALGRKDILASDGVVMKKTSDQKRVRQRNDEEAIVFKMTGLKEWEMRVLQFIAFSSTSFNSSVFFFLK